MIHNSCLLYSPRYWFLISILNKKPNLGAKLWLPWLLCCKTVFLDSHASRKECALHLCSPTPLRWLRQQVQAASRVQRTRAKSPQPPAATALPLYSWQEERCPSGWRTYLYSRDAAGPLALVLVSARLAALSAPHPIWEQKNNAFLSPRAILGKTSATNYGII